MTCMESVRNVPAYAYSYDFWVVRVVDGVAWFYGAYGDGARARDVAAQVDGVAVEAF